MHRAWLTISMLATVGPVAAAQSMNIDLGNFKIGGPNRSTPSDAYGAAASQPGFWNTDGISSPANLLDLAGAPTAAVLGSSIGKGGAAFAGTADENAFMGDAVFGSGAGISTTGIGVSGLLPGSYRLYLYGWSAPFGSFLGGRYLLSSRIGSIGQSEFKELTYTAWTGAQIEGKTFLTWDFVVSGPGHSLEIYLQNLGDPDNQKPSYVNGLQLVRIPTPGAGAAFMAMASLYGPRRHRARSLTAPHT